MNTISIEILGYTQLDFTCSETSATCVVACAKGENVTTEVCDAFADPNYPQAKLATIEANIGYESYSCNMALTVEDTCGCQFNDAAPPCLNPPPTTPTPSPPSPSLHDLRQVLRH